ncbi:hypothetical protein D3C85_1864680 [compost metagenome]
MPAILQWLIKLPAEDAVALFAYCCGLEELALPVKLIELLSGDVMVILLFPVHFTSFTRCA